MQRGVDIYMVARLACSRLPGFIEESTNRHMISGMKTNPMHHFPRTTSCENPKRWRITNVVAPFPILQLRDDAKPETWWIFRWSYADGWEWLLINFEQQIFWHRHMVNVVRLWNSGDGMWDPEEWALQDWPRKTILEVLEETGVCVDNDGNRENKEDDTESDTDESDKGGDEDEDEGSDDLYHHRHFWPLKPDLSDQLFVAFSKAFE